MNPKHVEEISRVLDLGRHQVEAAVALLADNATIPFIARYRKEATGSLDEVDLSAIRDRIRQLTELDARRKAILKSLQRHGHLSDELSARVQACDTLTALEDLYLPYRPKRRTRAAMARERGLEPLAMLILEQSGQDPETAAAAFIDTAQGVNNAQEALAGARDIIAETINEDGEVRHRMRALYRRQAVIQSRVAVGKETLGAKFRDYFQWTESAARAPSHRVLAMRRGEKEEVLNLSFQPPESAALELLEKQFVKGVDSDADQVRQAAADGYKRLLSRSMETELRLAIKERADGEAIRVFAQNLRELLLDPPLGAKNVMGIDPGFRTGCKLVCLDRQGKLLHHDTLYLHQSDKAAQNVIKLCERYHIEAIAVGNGTAGRETLAFVRALSLPASPLVVMVNESGASIYSASSAAREEFPDLDLTVRGGVSIGRRLMDPLSELVKIDPKSIGVGQYQYDVDQNALREALDDVVTSCVNGVGVDVNRASAQLLTYVSGLGPSLAQNIVAFRNARGPFRSREQFKEVPRLGPKAFEQAAGFLRIPGADNPLDASAVHPESYAVVDAMAAKLDCSPADLIASSTLRERIRLEDYVSDRFGLPTLADIKAELAKPGRDPRKSFEAFEYAGHVQTMADLKTGMRLPGTVTNVTAFGAFVDVGVHQDGLVHISQLADRFVRNPAEVVRVNQKVHVTVIGVDIERRRIALSMRSQPGEAQAPNSKLPIRKTRPHGRKPADRAPKKSFHNPFAEAFDKK